MERAVDEFNRARDRMAGDFKAMIADSEDLLKAAATVTDQGFNAARAKFEDKLHKAKAALVAASQPVFESTRESAAVADDYVRENPWTAMGVAAAAGVLLGLLAAKH